MTAGEGEPGRAPEREPGRQHERDDRLDPDMIPIYRQMTPGQRIMAGLAATELIRDRLRAHLGALNPDWDEARLERAVADRLLEARDRG